MSRATDSLWQRARARFRQHKRALWSARVLLLLFALSLLAPLWSNDKPLWLQYQGQSYFPLFNTYYETDFGGDFATPADYLDPYLRQLLSENGNRMVMPPNPYGAKTLNEAVQIQADFVRENASANMEKVREAAEAARVAVVDGAKAVQTEVSAIYKKAA